MKKILSLILTLILLLSLCACQKNQLSFDEIKADAEPSFFPHLEFDVDATENLVRAKEKYIGKSYYVLGFVNTITDKYITLRFIDTKVSISAYLSKEDILKLNINEGIELVGRISDVTENSQIVMKQAYYLRNTFESRATIYSKNYVGKGASYCFARLDRFVGDTIMPECNIILNSSDFAYVKEFDQVTVKGNLYLVNNNGAPLEFRNTELLSE